MKKILELSYNDMRNMIREPMLLMIILAPLLANVATFVGLPYAAEWISSYVDLIPYYPVLYAYIFLITPLLVGTVVGFLLLDEKEDGTRICLMVTPLGKKGYLLYRIMMPTVGSFLYTVLLLPFYQGRVESIAKLIPIALLTALEAPMIALYLSIFAENKVEGLVFSKSLGLLMLPPLLPQFLSSKLTILAGITPMYWPIQAFIKMQESSFFYLGYISIGFVIHLFFFTLLLRRFHKQIK